MQHTTKRFAQLTLAAAYAIATADIASDGEPSLLDEGLVITEEPLPSVVSHVNDMWGAHYAPDDVIGCTQARKYQF